MTLTNPKIAFQGDFGSYSEAAALQWAADSTTTTTVGFDSIGEVVQAVADGSATHGILPFENSLIGTFTSTCRLLASPPPFGSTPVHIVGEVVLHETHCLLALPGTTVSQVKTIQTHPAILDQCSEYLSKLSVDQASSKDTAGMAKSIAAQKLTTVATIASERAAQLYGLDILQKGIEDFRNSVTRFIIIAQNPIIPERHLNPKTTITFTLKNATGSLFKALSCFALRDINLAKIESFKSPRDGAMSSNPWEYSFLLDVEGSIAEGNVANAIRNLEEFATSLRVLGTYPKGHLKQEMSPGGGIFGIGL